MTPSTTAREVLRALAPFRGWGHSWGAVDRRQRVIPCCVLTAEALRPWTGRGYLEVPVDDRAALCTWSDRGYVDPWISVRRAASLVGLGLDHVVEPGGLDAPLAGRVHVMQGWQSVEPPLDGVGERGGHSWVWIADPVEVWWGWRVHSTPAGPAGTQVEGALRIPLEEAIDAEGRPTGWPDPMLLPSYAAGVAWVALPELDGGLHV